MSEIGMLDRLGTEPRLIDRVYDRLVMAIATGRLPEGGRVKQEEVAEMLGISRQPVSHALQLLKYRGLLVEHGRRGLAVAPLEAVRIRGLYQVREALDGLAARLAAERVREGWAQPDEVAAFRKTLREGATLEAGSPVSAFMRTDAAFHRALYALSGNHEIENTVAEQWPQFMRSMAVVLEDHAIHGKIWGEHEDIADAVCAGDPETAEDRARDHSQRAGAYAVRKLSTRDVDARVDG